MNSRQKLIYRTAKHFWIAIKQNSNSTQTWQQFYRNFKWAYRHLSFEDVWKQNEWVKTQY